MCEQPVVLVAQGRKPRQGACGGCSAGDRQLLCPLLSHTCMETQTPPRSPLSSLQGLQSAMCKDFMGGVGWGQEPAVGWPGMDTKLEVAVLQESVAKMGIASGAEIEDWFMAETLGVSGTVDLLDWSSLIDSRTKLSKHLVVPNAQAGQLEPLLSRFAEEEQLQMTRMLQRMDVLAKKATEMGVRLMVDAEQTYFQPAISRLTLEMQRKFNVEKPLIFNTYQCYLKDAYDNVTLDMELAHREGWCFGAKLVRGAHLAQERACAAEIGYEDPINPMYEATNAMYHRCLDYVEEELKHNAKAKVMVASHNEDTVRFALRRCVGDGTDSLSPHAQAWWPAVPSTRELDRLTFSTRTGLVASTAQHSGAGQTHFLHMHRPGGQHCPALGSWTDSLSPHAQAWWPAVPSTRELDRLTFSTRTGLVASTAQHSGAGQTHFLHTHRPGGQHCPALGSWTDSLSPHAQAWWPARPSTRELDRLTFSTRTGLVASTAQHSGAGQTHFLHTHRPGGQQCPALRRWTDSLSPHAQAWWPAVPSTWELDRLTFSTRTGLVASSAQHSGAGQTHFLHTHRPGGQHCPALGSWWGVLSACHQDSQPLGGLSMLVDSQPD
ncbi:uncharacterized protein LOC100994912 isoform X1 [Pan paniscus]|uniref:uncharacterized protein LOC100994912 isoform X1 n=2 Tax=Pan paniscus TaxID=9597 RepID=UPI00156017D4